MAVSSATACLPDETIFSFVQGKLPRNEADGIDEHLSRCPDCRTVVAEAARFLFQEQPPDGVSRGTNQDPTLGSSETSYRSLEPGIQVSRYVIGEIIGAGAAGVVYRAHDPQLKRAIALKLLRPDRSSEAEEEAPKARLLREAQAMAQLSHPNVVTVFDVGTFEDQIFIVMELVEGQTLARWLAAARPAWSEIVGAFIDAGRGLAAAHAVQIVHRDFKPANILVGRDGRVRVTDFGLARPMEIGPPGGPEASHVGLADRNAHTVLASLTATEGGLAGTPTYMAPEQFLGRRTVPRTDQFSFCVALYIALYETHPFADDGPEVRTLMTLAKAVVEGHLRSPPKSSPVPGRVFEVLARGLSTHPGERFHSMQELLDALTQASSSAAIAPRRRQVLGLAAALALLGLVIGAISAATAVQRAPRMAAPDSAALAAAPPAPAIDSSPPEIATVAPERPAASASSPKRRAAPSTDRKVRGLSARPVRERYDNGLKEPF
jgi:tRNA A-37 threonylcarbamoyl transferase component Bud32